MSIILTNPTDTELNQAFDTHVTKSVPCDGWHPFIAGAGSWMLSDTCDHDKCHPRACPIDYCNHIEAILPIADVCVCTFKRVCGYEGFPETWEVDIFDGVREGAHKDDSLPRAVVVALLRAHGVTVEFTS
jgi:hypothetical protein